MIVVLVLTALIAAVLAVAVVLLWRRLRALEADRPSIDVVTRGGATSTREVDAIVIEITNHAEVAASRTLLAKPLAAVTPGLIRSIVNREALRIMREQVAEQGVAADVRIRRLRMPAGDTPPQVLEGAPVDTDEHTALD